MKTELDAFYRMVDDIESVMTATATPSAVLVGLCVDGVWRAIRPSAQGRIAIWRKSSVRRLAPVRPSWRGCWPGSANPTADARTRVNCSKRPGSTPPPDLLRV